MNILKYSSLSNLSRHKVSGKFSSCLSCRQANLGDKVSLFFCQKLFFEEINPFSIDARWTRTKSDAVQRISIHNLLGQEVMNVKPNVTSSQLDLSSLRGGIYLVKVQVGDVTQTFKVIKE